MRFSSLLDALDRASGGNGVLCAAAIVGGVLLLIALTVACLCKNVGVYAGLSLLVVGGNECVIFTADTAVRASVFFRAVTWFSVGTLWLLTALIISLSLRAQKRKKRLIAAEKGGLGLLPERGNSYVRARLNTALRADEHGVADTERKSVPYENREAVRLGYARRLLAGVQDAALSPAERLETDRLAQSFAQYAVCERWSAEQLREVNELFARLLKLAAKYSVAE